jgi:hypothetical protein
VKTFLFSILILAMSGCEFGVGYHHTHHHSEPIIYDEVYIHYETYPYITSPDVCYYDQGTEFCEWTSYAAPYTECVETWYYDTYWHEWALYDEYCYAI